MLTGENADIKKKRKERKKNTTRRKQTKGNISARADRKVGRGRMSTPDVGTACTVERKLGSAAEKEPYSSELFPLLLSIKEERQKPNY